MTTISNAGCARINVMMAVVGALLVLSLAILKPTALADTEPEIVDRAGPEIFPDAEIEVRLRDGTRCDIVTATHAIEADFSPKWAEAVGQSLHYAEITGKKPGVLVLIRDPAKEWRHLVRLARLCGKHGITLWIHEVKE